MSFKIKPLDNQVSREPTTIIVHPAQVVLCAGIGSGKTTLIINLLINVAFFKGFFDRIIIFSPLPLRLDPKWKKLLKMKGVLRAKPTEVAPDVIQLWDTMDVVKKEDPRRINPDDIYTEFDAEALTEFLEEQKDNLESGASRVCVIFEDCPGLDMFSGKNGKLMQKLATTLRHYQCTVFYCTQSYMLIPRTIRNNCTHLVVWDIQNILERRKIHAEHPMVGSFDNFNKLFDELMNTGVHPFIFFNFRNPPRKQIVLNFDRIIET